MTDPPIPTSPAPTEGAPPAPAPPRRALVVDDEPVIRFALRRFFQRQGWEVDEAEGGQAALTLLLDESPEARRYDVVISDLRMPGVSGMDLYARLSRDRPALLERLIFSTGDTVSPDAAAFLRTSSCPVLGKPFELAELRALVARICGA